MYKRDRERGEKVGMDGVDGSERVQGSFLATLPPRICMLA